MTRTPDNLPEQEGRDPLGLSSLPAMEAPASAWANIQAQLAQDQAPGTSERPGRQPAQWRWLAVAAVLLLAVIIILQVPKPIGPPPKERVAGELQPEEQLPMGHQPVEQATAEPRYAANEAGNFSQGLSQQQLDRMVNLSQGMEQRLRAYRDEVGMLPAGMAIRVTELEDMVAVLDSQLAQAPDSADLWYQRVTLMSDLLGLYSVQSETNSGLLASL